MKKYKVGMYGGKFLPMHKGHLYCLDVAARECELVHLIIFVNGDQEISITGLKSDDQDLFIMNRIKQCMRVAARYDNVVVDVIDVRLCKNLDGTEDWDAETPLVLARCGHLDAVYGSEPSYALYFKRAYPDAVYRCLDPKRKEVNISSTKIREMSIDERKEWMV